MATSNTQKPFLTRCLAAVALIGIYCVSIVGASTILTAAGTTSAEARGGRGGGGRGGGRGRGGGWGRGRGGGRGWGRGRGWGPGFGIVTPGCFYNRWGRLVCPY